MKAWVISDFHDGNHLGTIWRYIDIRSIWVGADVNQVHGLKGVFRRICRQGKRGSLMTDLNLLENPYERAVIESWCAGLITISTAAATLGIEAEEVIIHTKQLGLELPSIAEGELRWITDASRPGAKRR